jgi:hypothetical protein
MSAWVKKLMLAHKNLVAALLRWVGLWPIKCPAGSDMPALPFWVASEPLKFRTQ